MHDCPDCGQACDCDGEDTFIGYAPDICECSCWAEEAADDAGYEAFCEEESEL